MQHLELARDIAERMNSKYGGNKWKKLGGRGGRIFKVPDAFIAPVGARVMSLTVSHQYEYIYNLSNNATISAFHASPHLSSLHQCCFQKLYIKKPKFSCLQVRELQNSASVHADQTITQNTASYTSASTIHTSFLFSNR